MNVFIAEAQIHRMLNSRDFYVYESLECKEIQGILVPVFEVKLCTEHEVIDTFQGRLHVRAYTPVPSEVMLYLLKESVVPSIWDKKATK